MADVDAVWDRVEEWLTRCAPRWRAMLNPPATAAELSGVQHTLGAQLSADLAAWWRRVNGLRLDSGSPPGSLIPESFHPFCTELAVETWRMYLSIQRDVYPPELHEEMDRYVATMTSRPAGTNPAEWLWLPAWVPLATNGMGDCLFVDLRQGPLHGCVTYFDEIDGSDAEPRWPGLAAMWRQVADLLETVDHAEFDRTGIVTIGRWTVPYG